MLRGGVWSPGHIRGDMCLCTVNFRVLAAIFLRVTTYISLIDSDILQTIKELLWQATLRSNNNFFKTSLKPLAPLLTPPPELRGSFLSEFQSMSLWFLSWRGLVSEANLGLSREFLCCNVLK